MDWLLSYFSILPVAVLLHAAIVLLVSWRVVMRRRPVGVALAWMSITLAFPFIGAVFYLMLGESRVGRRSEREVEAILPPYRAWHGRLRERASDIPWEELGQPVRALHRLGVATVGIPTLSGNRLQLVEDADAILLGLAADVERAEHSVHFEFYIAAEGGHVQTIVEALIAAAGRGVACRLLLDALGSAEFLASPTRRALDDAGVRVVEALPFSVIRPPPVRADHRNHRKLAVIDGRFAWIGSINLADPRWFKQEAGVGRWIDTMVRLEGPAVEALGSVFVADWELETGEGLAHHAGSAWMAPQPAVGDVPVQVFPSGPGYQPEALHQMLLTAIFGAREKLVLTTPYFVPSEAIMTAIVAAAHRGVAVTIIVPRRIDSRLVRLASRAYYLELLEAEVEIREFDRGLLHSKTITVDDAIAIVGSVNFDMRSFYVNFEISLFVYDRDFAREVHASQMRFAAESCRVELDEWRRRPVVRRLLENGAQLLSPLL